MRYTIAGYILLLAGGILIGCLSAIFSLPTMGIPGIGIVAGLFYFSGICFGTAYARKKYMDELYKNLGGKK